MTSQNNGQLQLNEIVPVILITSLIIILPGVQRATFDWIQNFLPLLSFYILSRYGEYTGKRLLLIASAFAFVVYLLTQKIDLLFSLTLLFLPGYVLFRSIKRQDSPALSGLKASCALAIIWFVLLNVFPIGAELSAYEQLTRAMVEGVDMILALSRQNDYFPPETLVVLEEEIYQLKTIIPSIMPAIIGVSILITIWFTMIAGNNILLKTNGHAPWGNYRYWQLPDSLIWLVIVAGIFTFLPLPFLGIIGANTAPLLAIIYFFQGLAITIFFINKWKIPLLLRLFFYVILFSQLLGLLIVLIVGIMDSWFDFRKLQREITK